MVTHPEAVQKVQLKSYLESGIEQLRWFSQLQPGREGFSPYILDSLASPDVSQDEQGISRRGASSRPSPRGAWGRAASSPSA
jgi:hypothetical protein